MQRYEYKVVPAPRKGDKAKGLKTTEARFAQSLTVILNEMAQQGWDYLRTDTLPVEERVGLTGRTTTFQHMLVFQKPLQIAAAVSASVAAPVVTSVAPPVAAPTAAATTPPAAVTTPAAEPASPPASDTQVPKLSTSVEAGQAPSLGPARDDQA